MGNSALCVEAVMKKLFISALVGTASGVCCTTISVALALTAPVSYPMVGAAVGYVYGRQRGVAKDEIGPTVCGALIASVCIPWAPVSIVCAPLHGVLCTIIATCGVYDELSK